MTKYIYPTTCFSTFQYSRDYLGGLSCGDNGQYFPPILLEDSNASNECESVNNYASVSVSIVTAETTEPCNPSPCGSNTICQETSRGASCQCIPDHFGDPYVACRPECVVNSDCPSDKACQQLHCVDPCPGTCGSNAICHVPNHLPVCTCLEGYAGDPFTACRRKASREY